MFRRCFVLASLTTLALGALAAPPVEQTRIERLIRFVETHKDMKFIRNGSEYSCEDAGQFLRGKLKAMGDDVTTARTFIERIASKSSMSGQPYQVKFSDGKTMLAANFLSEELNRIERQP